MLFLDLKVLVIVHLVPNRRFFLIRGLSKDYVVLSFITKNSEDDVATTACCSLERISWNSMASKSSFIPRNCIIFTFFFFLENSVRHLQFQHGLVLEYLIIKSLCISEMLKTFSCYGHAVLFLKTKASAQIHEVENRSFLMQTHFILYHMWNVLFPCYVHSDYAETCLRWTDRRWSSISQRQHNTRSYGEFKGWCIFYFSPLALTVLETLGFHRLHR